mmetsp:Transcript_23277/g.78811  ORF Transcript_23277/g.78811 Transcript_23277/m.78811 type:complete len:355 (-) Transcript_23277:404-1468(-)
MATPSQGVVIQHAVGSTAAVVQGQPPSDADYVAAEPAAAEVVVPKNMWPGDTFFATGPDGQVVKVIVPEGARPGDSIPVEQAYRPHATVVGVPIAGSDTYAVEEGRRFDADWSADQTPAGGWAAVGCGLYILGWLTCWFLGPCGPICWFATWARHYQRPKEERDLYPREARIAKLSCCTGITALAGHIVFVIVMLVWWGSGDLACTAMYAKPQCMRLLKPGIPVGVQFPVYCARKCGPARCYEKYIAGGPDGYSDDSLICGAALQSGAVEPGRGGVVMVTIIDGQPSYPSTKKNGLKSRTARGSMTSFIVQPVFQGISQNATNGTWNNSSGSENTIVRNMTTATSTSTTAPPAT